MTGKDIDSKLSYSLLKELPLVKLRLHKNKYGFFSRWTEEKDGVVEFKNVVYVTHDWFYKYKKFIKVRFQNETPHINITRIDLRESHYGVDCSWWTSFSGDFSIFILPNGRIIDVRRLFYFDFRNGEIKNIKKEMIKNDFVIQGICSDGKFIRFSYQEYLIESTEKYFLKIKLDFPT